MTPAERDEVRERRLAASGPVPDVVRVDEPVIVAAWETTAAVATPDGAT